MSPTAGFAAAEPVLGHPWLGTAEPTEQEGEGSQKQGELQHMEKGEYTDGLRTEDK